ncbi:putative reverse transcriptase domain-containing protein [Tanacetum coccineum]
MPPRMRTRSAGQPVAESLGRGERGEQLVYVEGVKTMGMTDKRVNEIEWSRKMTKGKGANGGNRESQWRNVRGSQGVAPEFSMIIAQQLQNLLPAKLAQCIKLAITVQISGALTDEAVRNGSIKKVVKRGSVGEPNKDSSGRDDNKRTRTVNAFATTANPVVRENAITWPKCTICNSFHAPSGLCRICYNCNRLGHLARDCRSVPRNVNPVNDTNPTIRGKLREW